MKGGLKNLQDAVTSSTPQPLKTYMRKCYHSGCSGTISVTKTINSQIWIDTIIHQDENAIECKLEDIPLNIELNTFT